MGQVKPSIDIGLYLCLSHLLGSPFYTCTLNFGWFSLNSLLSVEFMCYHYTRLWSVCACTAYLCLHMFMCHVKRPEVNDRGLLQPLPTWSSETQSLTVNLELIKSSNPQQSWGRVGITDAHGCVFIVYALLIWWNSCSNDSAASILSTEVPPQPRWALIIRAPRCEIVTYF